jgi:hypothetical protein
LEREKIENMEKIISSLIYVLPILQIFSYLYIDYKKIKFRKRYIISFILLIYFILPYIVNNLEQREQGCLLPVISLYGAIWLIGIFFTAITHLVYIILKRILLRKPNR